IALTEMPTCRHINLPLVVVDPGETTQLLLSPNDHDGSGLSLSEARRRIIAVSDLPETARLMISHIHQSAARRDSRMVWCRSCHCLSLFPLLLPFLSLASVNQARIRVSRGAIAVMEKGIKQPRAMNRGWEGGAVLDHLRDA
ncbi:hypothetical protein COCVIDRAFT_110159, partial [Bipolaris victoriae FI3]